MIVLKRGFIFTKNGIVKHRKFKCLDRRHFMKKNENRITNTVHNVQLTVRTKRFVFLYLSFWMYVTKHTTCMYNVKLTTSIRTYTFVFLL